MKKRDLFTKLSRKRKNVTKYVRLIFSRSIRIYHQILAPQKLQSPQNIEINERFSFDKQLANFSIANIV